MTAPTTPEGAADLAARLDSLPTRPAEPRFPVTRREFRTLQHAANGLTSRQIGSVLGVHEETIKSRLQVILRKLHAQSRAHAVAVALATGAMPMTVVKVPGELKKLSPTQRQVLLLVAAGETNASIAAACGKSYDTVGTHLRHVMRKLGVSCRTQAVAVALAAGVLGVDEIPVVGQAVEEAEEQVAA